MTSKRSFPCPGRKSAIGEIAVVQIEGLGEETSARSARTRRSFRSTSRETESGTEGFEYGFVCNGLVCNKRVCRVDSVKHTTSPSRRTKRAARYQIASFFKVSLPLPNTRLPGAASPRYLKSVFFNTFASCAFPSLRLPVAHRVPHLPCSKRNVAPTPGNSDTEQPSSYCYELPTQLRLESVANAHTAADLHVRSRVSYRAGLKSLERRERAMNTPCGNPDNP